MKTLLLALLVVLQLLCLGVMHYRSAAELAACPHEVVEAKWIGNRTVRSSDGYVWFRLDPYSVTAYRKAVRKYGEEKLHLTMEIARRKGRPDMATNLFVNDVPVADAVSIMNRGELPQAQ